jgi:hypothetical protein
LQIELVPLPGYSPDFMPVEALWRWLREDVTYLYPPGCLVGQSDRLARRADLSGATSHLPVPRAPVVDMCPDGLATTEAQ